jgi:hypothetical protein
MLSSTLSWAKEHWYAVCILSVQLKQLLCLFLVKAILFHHLLGVLLNHLRAIHLRLLLEALLVITVLSHNTGTCHNQGCYSHCNLFHVFSFFGVYYLLFLCCNCLYDAARQKKFKTATTKKC